MYVKKRYVWNPATCRYENGKYLASSMDDSAIICDEVIDADADAKSHDEAKSNDAKLSPQILMKRKQPAKRKMSILYLHFY